MSHIFSKLIAKHFSDIRNAFRQHFPRCRSIEHRVKAMHGAFDFMAFSRNAFIVQKPGVQHTVIVQTVELRHFDVGRRQAGMAVRLPGCGKPAEWIQDQD